MGAGKVFSDELIQDVERNHGLLAATRVQYWLEIIKDGKVLSDSARCYLANSCFNAATFRPDKEVYGVNDYWATPLEFLIHDAGDCEDFAIAKYFTLLAMGVEPTKLRLTYVYTLALNQAHMVLAYYSTPDTEPQILDSLNLRILFASERQDLKPLYAFNGSQLFIMNTWLDQVQMGDPMSLSLWKGLCSRYQAGIALNSALFS